MMIYHEHYIVLSYLVLLFHMIYDQHDIFVAMAVFISTSILFLLVNTYHYKEYTQKPIYINYKVHDACRKSRNLNPIMLQYPPCQLIFVPKIQGVYRSGSLLTRSPRLSAVFSVRSNRPLYFHSLFLCTIFGFAFAVNRIL